jgi:hypothetical protein
VLLHSNLLLLTLCFAAVHHCCWPTGGASLGEAFEQAGLAMFNYMTPIDELRVDEACSR